MGRISAEPVVGFVGLAAGAFRIKVRRGLLAPVPLLVRCRRYGKVP